MYVKEYLAFIAEVHKIEDVKKKINSVIELTGLTVESKKRSDNYQKDISKESVWQRHLFMIRKF